MARKGYVMASLKNEGRAQRVYPATLKRVQDRAAKLRAADPLHREVTFDQAVTWMLDKLDELDRQEEGQ
jgi:hypothetical protein